jgi:hypothetical protein
MGRLATLMALGAVAACGAPAEPRAVGRPTTATASKASPVVAVVPLSTVAKTDVEPGAPSRRRRAAVAEIPEHVLLRAMHRRRPSLNRCYHAERRRDPSLTTIKIPITLRISAGGAVESARIDATPRMQGCIDAVIRRVRVPAPGAPVDVAVPLVFSAS